MIVFSVEWFEKYQKQLLWFANTAWGRYVLRIRGGRSGVGKNKIIKIEPFAITWIEDGKNKIEIRSHSKYSKRIYHAFKWVWWLAHGWDFGIANNLNTALNVGFDTLTSYPDNTTTVDGEVSRVSVNSTFTSLRTSAGNDSDASLTSGNLWTINTDYNNTNRWLYMSRSVFVFNTTTIPSASTLDSASIDLYFSVKQDDNGLTATEGETVLVSHNTTSDTTLVNGDYNIAKFGTTALANRIAYSSWVAGYNTFNLNASGLTNINVSTNSRFGVMAGFDFDNDEPTWVGSFTRVSVVNTYFANYTGTSRDPRLTITYTPPVSAYYSSSNPYADGKLMRDTGSGWADVATSDLRFITYTDEGDTTVPQLSVDPSDIVRDALDYFNDNGGNLTYDISSIPDTGTTVSYTFVSQTILEVINKALELAPNGWYWYIDYSTNTFYFKSKSLSADHKLILGKDIKTLLPEKRSDNIINTVYFTGGDTGSGILYMKFQDAYSVATYGVRAIRYIDERVTLASTATILANSVINNNSAPEVRLSTVVVDSNIDSLGYDIESIDVGDVINVQNVAGSSGSSLYDVAVWDIDKWDFNITQIGTMYLQIIRKEYEPTGLAIYCSSIPVDVNKRIEDINRNLEALQTVNNPDTPA